MKSTLILLAILGILTLSGLFLFRNLQHQQLLQKAQNNRKGYVVTPFGYWPEKCINKKLPSNSKIVEGENKFEIHSGGHILTKHHDQDCLDHLKKFNQVRLSKLGDQSLHDGWLDNASWTTSENVQSFQASYSVPGDPENGSGQILYYFIGVENFQSDVSVTILQPVLTWSNNEWTFTSWNCCPGGEVNEGNPIQGFKAGDQLFGNIYQDKPLGVSGGKWNVISQNPAGDQSVLSVAPINRVFNWADATLETYSVTQCNQFAQGPIDYTNMEMVGVSGKKLNPQWEGDGSTSECGGSTKVVDVSHVQIVHTG